MSGSIAEPEERNCGHHPGDEEQHRQRPAGTGKHERARSLKKNEKNQSEWNEQDRFDEQPWDGGGAGLFSEQSIKAEGDAERDGDPREAAIIESEIQNSERGEQDRPKLQTGETFTEKNCAKENVHQRGHEITEAGLDDAVSVDRVNEEEPIRCYGQAAGQTINSLARRTHIGD